MIAKISQARAFLQVIPFLAWAALCPVLLAGEESRAARPAGAAVPAAGPVLGQLPEETLAVLSAPDLEATVARLEQTGLWKILSAPGLKAAFRTQLQMLRGQLKVGGDQLGVDPESLLQYFKGELTVALLGFLETQNEKGEPIPDLLVAFQPREKAQEWMDLWGRLVGNLNAKTNHTLKVTESVFAEASVVTLSHPELPIQLTYTLADGVFLAGLGAGRIEKILKLRQSAREAAAADKGAPQGPAPGTLAASAAFAGSRARAGLNPDLAFFLNLEAMRKHPAAKFGPKSEQEQKVWAIMGLNGIRSLSYAITAERQDLQESLYIDAPRAARSGLLGLLGSAGPSAGLLQQAPRTALLAAALQTDPPALLERILDLAGIGNPAARTQLEGFIGLLGLKTNLDAKKDLLGLFSGEVRFSVSLPDRPAPLNIGFPRLLLTLGLKDAAAFESRIPAVKAAASESFHIREFKHGELRITGLRQKGRSKDALQFCYAVLGKELLVGLYPLAIQEELDRLGSARESLGSWAAFKAQSAALPEAAQLGVYLDSAALLATAYDFLLALGQLQENRGNLREVNLFALPSSELLATQLKATVFGLAAEEAGLHLRARSTLGLWSSILPAAAWIDQQQRNQQAPAPPERAGTAAVPKGSRPVERPAAKTPEPPPVEPPDF